MGALSICETAGDYQALTELLCQRDSYLKRFAAVVTRVDSTGGRVELDRTAFFPGGGGQPCDSGKLAGIAVPRMETDSGILWHVIASDELPEVGDALEGEIDWWRRYLLMRTHSALHVLCGVVWRSLGAKVTGGNMVPGNGRLDFELTKLDRGLVEEIEAGCNREIRARREIRVHFLPRQEAETMPDLIRTKINLLPKSITEVRAVEIVGLDTQADGGTHVSNTSEIGAIRISKYKSKGAINKRLYLEIASGS